MRYLFLACTFYVLTCSALHGQSLSWHQLSCNGLSDTDTRIDDIYFLNELTGFAVTHHGYILKTLDGGTNWDIKLSASTNEYFRSIEFSDDGKYGIAGTLSGSIYRTADSGDTWTAVTNLPDTGMASNLICGLAHYGNTFYGVGWWGSKLARFYTSSNNGQNWQVKYLDTTLAAGLVDIQFLSANLCFAAGYKKNGSKSVSVLLRSTDAGQNWNEVFSDTTIGGRVWKIQFLNNQIGYGAIEPYYHIDSVCYIKTTDGGLNWTMIPVGKFDKITPGGSGVQGIGFIDEARGWIGGYFKGMFVTADSGKTWTRDSSLGINLNRFFRIDDTLMYASGKSVYALGYPTTISKTQAGKSETSNVLYPVYPNPAKSKINIAFDIKYLTNVVLEIANVESKVVYPVSSGYLKPGHYTYEWNAENVPNGNYIIWLGTDEIPIVQKFVIHK